MSSCVLTWFAREANRRARVSSTALRLAGLQRRPVALVVIGDQLGSLSTERRSFSSDSNQSQLAKTLYRQLLRWCKDTGDDMPLAQYLPPVTSMPPYIDQDSLDKLRTNEPSVDPLRAMLPSNTIFEGNMMTVPLRNSAHVSNFFRAVFRMNIEPTTPDILKDRVSMAFETVKSVNYLTAAIKDARAQREKHRDREGVEFCVGQVVQHKKDRWRGVVLGWEHVVPPSQPQGLTSLTTKDYQLPVGEDDESTNDDGSIQYTLIMDSGDAHLLGGRRRTSEHSYNPLAIQSDLELVTDMSLCRVRSNWVSNHFERFDATSKCFVPNEARQFEYPLDDAHLQISDKEVEADSKRNVIGAQIAGAVRTFATRLIRKVHDHTSEAETRGLNLIVDYEHRLSRLSQGDVLTDEDLLTRTDINDGLLGTLHLRWLLNMYLELAELLWQHQLAKASMDGDRITFRLGDIVQHKEYGFRGVVIAWDPKPVVDVSKWDGLQNIENPNEKAFYHVIPHQPDCIEVFGGERSMRYVCQDNLELTPRHRTIIDVDLDPGWDHDSAEARYIPPHDLRFKYGEEVDDDGITEQCLEALHSEVNMLHLAQRGLAGVDDDEVKEVGANVSVEVLFKFLRLANNMDSAIASQETIKELWKTHPDAALRKRLNDGTSELLRGNKEKALIFFQDLVVDDPNYAEAWNKASTAYFMMGDLQASLEAAEKTLELIPHHFQAMSGLGLIRFETRRYKLAAGMFRNSLQLDPWSPVSSRLATCLDLLHGMDLEEEQGAAEGTAPYE